MGSSPSDSLSDSLSAQSFLSRRMGARSQPQMVLTAAPSAHESRSYSGLPLALVNNDPQIGTDTPAVVLGGPGTGKSSLLIDAAVQHIVAGGKAEEIMFVAPSKEAASQLREQIFQRVATQDNYATKGAIIRSVHAWAFALLRSIRLAEGRQAPRLITGAEHDIEIRTLLRGMIQDGETAAWPENIRPALPMVGFARQLRDLLLRATERSVDSEELKRLGEEFSQPMWQGAGQFLRDYEQIQRLGQNENLNASELLHSVLAAMNSDQGERVHQDHQQSLKLVLVDDAHNLDPAAAQFIETYIRPGVRTIVAGDPDQCVFHFRGANEDFLNTLARTSETVVTLSQSHRVGPAVAAAVNKLRNHLPAQTSRVELRGRDSTAGATSADELSLITCTTNTAERLHVTNQVRRAHAERAVAWKDIAVIVRDSSSIPALRRTLLSYGVPVKLASTAVVLADQPLVAMLLLAVESAERQLTGPEAALLVESAVGGADPVMARRVQRRINAAMRAHGRLGEDAWTNLAALLHKPDAESNAWMTEFLGPREYTVVERVSKVVRAGQASYKAGDSVEMVLWRVWQATELSTQLQWRALRGGTSGSQADQDLDAVMNLFDLAGDFVERNPQASISTFVEDVRSQELPTAQRERRGTDGTAVEILPAHAAAGRQWKEVVIAGVQEDSWPAGPTVGGLFGQLELVDYKDHGDLPHEPRSRIAEAVQEERRLFLLAITRATSRTTITTISSLGEQALVPSRFLVETGLLSQAHIDGDEPLPLVDGKNSADMPRVLALEPLVAELRDAVEDPERDPALRRAAVRNLQRLHEAGVYGADPAQWWGTAAASTDAPVTRDGVVRLSPSALDALSQCTLQAFFNRHGASTEKTHHMSIGIVIHGIAEQIVQGMTLEDAQAAMRTMLPAVIDGPQWMKRTYVEEWEDGIARLHDWITTTMDSDSTFETERTLFATVGVTESGHTVHLKGRADLIERQPDSTCFVYDFKTGGNPKSVAEAEASLQLAGYQFMLAQDDTITNGGAALVYPFPNGKSAAMRLQSQFTPEHIEQLREQLLVTGDSYAGPTYAATVGSACDNCKFKSLCPAQPQGKTVV